MHRLVLGDRDAAEVRMIPEWRSPQIVGQCCKGKKAETKKRLTRFAQCVGFCFDDETHLHRLVSVLGEHVAL